MKVTVILGTFGDRSWQRLAAERAAPSAAEQQPWEVLACHLENGTLAEARNKAAAEATGDWLCFLDADDELCDGYLDAMERAWWGHTHQPGEVRTESGPLPTRIGDLASPALLVPSVSYGGSPPRIPDWGRPIEDVNCAVIGSLVSKATFDQAGGFAEWPIYEDWDLWLRCVEQGAQLVPVEEAVYCAHSRGSGRNLHDPKVALDTYALIRQRHLERMAAR